MSDTGWKNNGTASNDQTVGSGNIWSNLEGTITSDNNYCSQTINLGVTCYIKTASFSFGVPAGATINGVEIGIEEKSSDPGFGNEQYVKLVKGGVISGNDISAHNALTGTDTYQTAGGPTELAGLALTADDVNASDFGCVVNYTQSKGQTISVDHIRMKVYYTEYTPPETPIVGLKYPIPPFKKA